jgi:hypothetical protein
MEIEFPYVPAVTAVLASEIVPVDVIGPPVRPVPVATFETPPAVDAMVTVPPAPLSVSVILVPAVRTRSLGKLDEAESTT